jgi:predicted RNA binding protein YcfA (HicA-like mRNA interferase family)
MNHAPVLTPRDIASLLILYGFDDIEESESPQRFRHSDGRVTTITDIPDGAIAPALLRRIAADTDMTLDAFLAG